MKTFLMIVGIVLLVACVLSLCIAAVCYFGRNTVLDGSPELYRRLERRALVFGAVGIALALAGTACLVIRIRL